MNEFHASVKALTDVHTVGKLLRLYVCLFIFLYFCFAHFTLLLYKSSIMVVENFQKYHWIQHKNVQPVVIMTKRNKLL